MVRFRKESETNGFWFIAFIKGKRCFRLSPVKKEALDFLSDYIENYRVKKEISNFINMEGLISPLIGYF